MDSASHVYTLGKWLKCVGLLSFGSMAIFELLDSRMGQVLNINYLDESSQKASKAEAINPFYR